MSAEHSTWFIETETLIEHVASSRAYPCPRETPFTPTHYTLPIFLRCHSRHYYNLYASEIHYFARCIETIAM